MITTAGDVAPDRKAIAVEFLRLLRTGDRDGASRLVAPGARHHNAYFAAGMPTLIDAAVQAAKQAPDRSSDVRLVLADGDHVAVHSHVFHQVGHPGVSVVHIFRFEGDRIAELWDVGQPVPADSPNADGMF
jgi:predicted SnoaL-like aldol condensation-catalyzing enzyme